MKVAITIYPRGGERTVWMDMPMPPRVGESVHVPELDRIVSIDHVRWAIEHGQWQMECDAS